MRWRLPSGNGEQLILHWKLISVSCRGVVPFRCHRCNGAKGIYLCICPLTVPGTGPPASSHLRLPRILLASAQPFFNVGLSGCRYRCPSLLARQAQQARQVGT